MRVSSTWIPPLELEVPPTGMVQPLFRPKPVMLPTGDDLRPHPSKRTEPLLAAPSDETDPQTPVVARRKTTRRHGLFWGLVGVTLLLLVSLLIRDTLLFLLQQWQTHPLLGGFFSLLVLAMTGLLLTLTGREWIRFRRLRTLSTLRQETGHLMDSQTFGSGQRLVNRIILLYRDRTEMEPSLQQFHRQVNDYLGDREMLTLFSTQVLSVVDTQAYQVVVRHASAAAVMTAISPLAWLDTLFFLWRNLWMVREIAEVYGARPGATGSLLLLRQAVQGIMGAGLADLLANSAAHSMGDSVAALLMAKAGQGIANGLFIARIGLQTMHACRPLPFGDGERPGLARIRRALQQEIKKSLNPSEQKDS